MWRTTKTLLHFQGNKVCKSFQSNSFQTKVAVSQGKAALRNDSVILSPAKLAGKQTPARCLHTTNRQHAPALLGPVLVKLSKPISRLVFLFLGRHLRNWWARLPADQRAVYRVKLRENRRFIIGASGVFCCGMGGYYYSHLEETPITGRLRFIMLNEEQLLKVTKTETKLLDRLYEKNKLPTTDARYRRVYHIVARLLAANQLDTTELVKRVNVVVSVEENAFVVPNGDVYVLTGMLDAVANDDELAGVLGHELAHNLCGHSAEQLSRAGFFSVFSIIVFTAIWALGSSDLASIFASWLQSQIEDVLIDLPYSRKMEREADEVGLMLTARACYDVTKIPDFWTRMDYMESLQKGVQPGVDENMDFFSTHPSHLKRITWLNENMEKALEIRKDMDCPDISHFIQKARRGLFSWLF